MSVEVHDIKHAATGRWREVIVSLGGLDEHLLDGKHHPCPRCGGIDRFSMVDEQAGALLCRKCFDKQNGDGIAALQWLNSWDFPTTLKALAGYLGLEPAFGEPAKLNIVEAVARRKRIPLESFKAFGAHKAKRGTVDVARVPMYDHMGEPCSHFDMSTIPELDKGKAASGMPVGLFLERLPQPGDRVILTEGVKDAGALHGQGYFAVGLPTKEMDAKFARLFVGCEVVIVPDRDIPGTEGANKTAARLAGTASGVGIASLPSELKEKNGDGVREILAKRNGPVLLKQAIDDAVAWSPGQVGRPVQISTVEKACGKYLDALESGETQTIKSGIRELDDSIGGVAFGEMVVIGARPSHGKTMFALQWLDFASESELPGLIVSEEMSDIAIGKRSLQYVSDMPEAKWRDEMHFMRLNVKAHFEGRMPVLIAESCGTAERAAKAIDDAVQHKGVRVVAVDYAQLLKGEGSSRYEQVTNTSLLLKQCATRNGIVLLLLCQLSRDIEKRPDRTPRMSDLRDSGQFEQDADVILFLQWPLKDDPTYKPHEEYRIYVAKNRNRQTKRPVVVTHFDPTRQRLHSPEPENYVTDFDDFNNR